MKVHGIMQQLPHITSSSATAMSLTLAGPDHLFQYRMICLMILCVEQSLLLLLPFGIYFCHLFLFGGIAFISIILASSSAVTSPGKLVLLKGNFRATITSFLGHLLDHIRS